MGSTEEGTGTMAISHKDHNHPNTPAARAACRKIRAAMEAGTAFAPAFTRDPSAERALAEAAGIINKANIARVITAEDEARLADQLVEGVHPRRAAKLAVVPRTRGDGGVVKGMIAAQPVVKARRVKAYDRPIRSNGDLPMDIPVDLVRTIESAWGKGWDVVEGMPLNGDETRILIGGELAQVSLVFNGAGGSGVFVRSLTSSITHRVDSGPQAMALASGDEEWPWVSGNKLV
jgi:hypothetical protein